MCLQLRLRLSAGRAQLSTTVVLLGAELSAEMERQTARDTTVDGHKPLEIHQPRMADPPCPAEKKGHRTLRLNLDGLRRLNRFVHGSGVRDGDARELLRPQVAVGLVRVRLAVGPLAGVHDAPVIDTYARFARPVIRFQSARDGQDVIVIGKVHPGRYAVRHTQGPVLGLELQLHLGAPQRRAHRDEVLDPQGGILALQLPDHMVGNDRTHRARDEQDVVLTECPEALGQPDPDLAGEALLRAMMPHITAPWCATCAAQGKILVKLEAEPRFNDSCRSWKPTSAGARTW